MTTSVRDPLVGHALEGRYEITDRLARGGMATVYRAHDNRLGRTVAVKVMHEGLGDDQDFSRKFDREARAAARLSHPNVVSVFDQGHDGGRPYIVMEYVPGSTLRSVIVRDAPLDALRALDFMEPVLAALAAAHEAGLVHRDVKPENVLISDRGQLKVADFGLAKAVSAQTATATQGLLIGTVSYLPPELVTIGRADTRSDVYSAGVVLWEMLTGRKPHTGDTPIQVAYAHVHNDIGPVSDFLPGSERAHFPDYLDALVLSATRRDPTQRPADAAQFLRNVRQARSALADGVSSDPRLVAAFTIDPGETSPVGKVKLVRRAAVEIETAGAVEAGVAPDTDSGPVETSAPVLGSGLAAGSPGTAQTPTPADRPGSAGRVSPGSPPVNHTDPPTAARRDSAPSAGSPARQGRPIVRPTTPRTPASADEIEDTPTDLRPFPAEVYRRRRRGVVLLIGLLLLGLVGGLGGWWLLAGRWTEAPGLVGLPRADAVAAAAAADVELTFNEAYSETVPVEQVISSAPAAGERITRGSAVEVTLSLGPERFVVPTVVGSSLADAEASLREVNLSVGEVTEVWDEKAAEGVVTTASVEPGTEVKRDTPVDLTVSKGREPIPVTNVTGQSLADAKATLEKSGLAVTSTEEHSKTVAKGLVIGQDPAKGNLHRGDTVALTVSKGPVMVTVPNVKSMGVKDATALMEEKGFKVTTKPVAENYLGLGYVSYTDPGIGKQAVEGSTITLYLV